MKIVSKREFFRLWEAGVLGNRTMLWRDIDDAMASGCPLIGFREMGRAGGGAWALVGRDDARDMAMVWKKAGRQFIMDNSVPNERSVLQGEVCRTFCGLESYLAIGRALPPMRISMREGRHQHFGYVQTTALLTHFMDPSSRDDLDALLELYPEATVEFTTFDVNVGHLPGRNTIFWETRNY
jgi:hypothetical protein